MAQAVSLKVPDAQAQYALYRRYFAENGATRDSVLEAVSLTLRRTDVFLNDALALFEERGQFRSACSAGCGYCCHTLLSVMPAEAFFVARHIETAFDDDARQALEARVRESDVDHRGRDGAARYTARAACPFLEPQSWYCALHEARPTVCRAMHSGSLQACKTAYATRDATVPAPTMKVFFRNRDATHAGMNAALEARGIASYPVELNAALVIIWDGERVMDRWLAGEDIFAPARLGAAPAQAREKRPKAG